MREWISRMKQSKTFSLAYLPRQRKSRKQEQAMMTANNQTVVYTCSSEKLFTLLHSYLILRLDCFNVDMSCGFRVACAVTGLYNIGVPAWPCSFKKSSEFKTKWLEVKFVTRDLLTAQLEASSLLRNCSVIINLEPIFNPKVILSAELCAVNNKYENHCKQCNAIQTKRK